MHPRTAPPHPSEGLRDPQPPPPGQEQEEMAGLSALPSLPCCAAPHPRERRSGSREHPGHQAEPAGEGASSRLCCHLARSFPTTGSPGACPGRDEGPPSVRKSPCQHVPLREGEMPGSHGVLRAAPADLHPAPGSKPAQNPLWTPALPGVRSPPSLRCSVPGGSCG